MYYNFRIDGGLKDGSGGFQLFAQRPRIHQVAVVRQREAAEIRFHPDRLRVPQKRRAGRRIPIVTDRGVADEFVQFIFAENVRDLAHAGFAIQAFAVGADDARGFLSAMLQGIEAQIREIRGLGTTVDAVDTAFLAWIKRRIVFVGCRRICGRAGLRIGSATHIPRWHAPAVRIQIFEDISGAASHCSVCSRSARPDRARAGCALIS